VIKQTKKCNFFGFPETTFQGEQSDLLIPSSIEELIVHYRNAPRTNNLRIQYGDRGEVARMKVRGGAGPGPLARRVPALANVA